MTHFCESHNDRYGSVLPSISASLLHCPHDECKHRAALGPCLDTTGVLSRPLALFRCLFEELIFLVWSQDIHTRYLLH
jgi:hypothetical protein